MELSLETMEVRGNHSSAIIVAEFSFAMLYSFQIFHCTITFVNRALHSDWKVRLVTEMYWVQEVSQQLQDTYLTSFYSQYSLTESNTNGGIPGQLTGNQVQKENYFSAATNVAYLSDVNFNGNIQYSAADDGLPTTTGVEVFASGERNPFGICLHSNGYLYGTDNGPNLGYVSSVHLYA